MVRGLSMRTPVWLSLVTLGAVLCATPGAWAGKNAAPPPKPQVVRYKVPLGDSPVRGPQAALVTVVGFIDYECPFCVRSHATVKALQAEYGTKFRYVVKQRPLPFHTRARAAAAAALAAGEQGAYWRMHDRLFENREGLEEELLRGHAEALGLDVERFLAAATEERWSAQFEQDEALAIRLGATGTPTFFINGRLLTGAQPLENFRKLINEELATARALVSAGTTTPERYYEVLMAGAQETPPAKPSAGPPRTQPGEVSARVPVPADAPSSGPEGAPVTLVAWMDFQCPFSARAYATVSELRERYGSNLRVIFRHQPLAFHGEAKPAALAAAAAQQQGRFWEMAQALFDAQQELGDERLGELAQELGLDLEQFNLDLESEALDERVERDMREGAAVGATGTPTFFINGRKVLGAQPRAVFEGIIDDELARGRAVLALGTPPEGLYDALLALNAQRFPSEKDAAPRVAVRLGNAPSLGAADAPVTLVVFADFQCPFCARAVGTVRKLREEFGERLRVVFKHNPLPFHANARGAALAAVAAQQQGRFWEMHDRLFADPSQLYPAALVEHARELGLDVPSFKAALKSARAGAQVDEDVAEAKRLGATGTPTFFINGKMLVGAQPYETFRDAVNDAL